MYRFNANNTTYLVPLDGLDLNSLNRSYDSGGVRPLWSTQYGENYYEFKVNAWRISEESDDEEITGLESESQICHICNTHVPIMYIKNHNNSVKHINMKKIHELVTIRGQNSDLNPSEEHTELKTNYYCEECSMVILKSNRQSHDKSYTHKKSLRNKDLIEQFLKFYSQDLNVYEIKTPMSNYFNKFLNRRNLTFKVDVVDDDNIVIIIKEFKVKLHSNNFHGFVKMDSETICILCEVQLQVNGIEPHIESKKHRKKITRHIEDQHCIREVNESFVHCLLCNELVLETRVAGHKLLSYHIFNLNQALGRKSSGDFNKNYIMSKETGNSVFADLSDELQSDGEESDDKSISNDELQSVDGESGGCESNEQLSTDIIVQNENIQATNQTYCNVCSIYIDTHNFKNHKMGSSHKQLESSKIKADQKTQQKVNDYIYKEIKAQHSDISEKLAPLDQYAAKNDNEHPSGATKEIKSINLHYHMEESSYNIVSCRICYLKMYIEDMNNHINHDSHITKYENLLKVNKVTKKNDYFCYCEVCDDPVLVKCELDHIYSIQHRNNINDEEESDLKTSINRNKETICELEKNANIDSDTNANEQINDTTQAITTDIQLDGSQRDETEVTEIPDDFIEKISYQILETTDENEIVCKVCDIKISNTDLYIFKHFDGADHALKYSELLKINRLTKAQNKFFCYACKASITSRNELEHIFGNKHKAKFPNHDIDAACKISCQIKEGHISVTVQSTDVHEQVNTQTTNDLSNSSVKSEAHPSDSKTKNEDYIAQIDNTQAVFIKEYYLVSKTKNPSEVICKVCKIILTNSMMNIETHMLGSDHKNRYESLLKFNGIKKQDNGFFCEACEVNLTNKNEMIHINGFRHQTKVLSYAISCLKAMCTRYSQEISGESVDQTTNTQSEALKLQEHLEESDNEMTEETIDQSDEIVAGNSYDNYEISEDDDEEVNEPYAESENDSVESSDESENGRLTTGTINFQTSFSKPHYHVTKITNSAQVLCKICNVLLSNSAVNIDTHVMGVNHTNKYNILLESNGLKKENNRFFCETCNVFVSNKNELEHIMGFRHKMRLPKDGDC